MRNVNIMAYLFLAVSIVGTTGCSSRKVTRLETDTVTDLSGRWNDEDSRLVSNEMIADCLTAAWKVSHQAKSEKAPIVIVGVVKNKTSEHIAMDTFIGDIERAFVNSGQVSVVASKDEREAVREERADQQTYSSEKTVKAWGKEVGADYMLGGTISSIIDEYRGEKVVFYQIDMTLIDLESNTKVWLGQKKIKKAIGRKKFSS